IAPAWLWNARSDSSRFGGAAGARLLVGRDGGGAAGGAAGAGATAGVARLSGTLMRPVVFGGATGAAPGFLAPPGVAAGFEGSSLPAENSHGFVATDSPGRRNVGWPHFSQARP